MLPKEIRTKLLQDAAFEITGRYYELASDLVSVVSVQITICTILRYMIYVFFFKLLDFYIRIS